MKCLVEDAVKKNGKKTQDKLERVIQLKGKHLDLETGLPVSLMFF